MESNTCFLAVVVDTPPICNAGAGIYVFAWSNTTVSSYPPPQIHFRERAGEKEKGGKQKRARKRKISPIHQPAIVCEEGKYSVGKGLREKDIKTAQKNMNKIT